MFRVENDVFKVTRGDKGIFTFSIDDYTFEVGDIIKFKIYNKKGLDLPPVFYKEIIIKNACESIDIYFTSEDTRIGELLNKRKEYWYEIELNENQTVKGFDDDGAKIFYLYPEGANPKVADEEADSNGGD